jgi:hypothetical protein
LKDASECHHFASSASEYGERFHLYQSTGTPCCTMLHRIVKLSMCLYGLSVFTPLKDWNGEPEREGVNGSR